LVRHMLRSGLWLFVLSLAFLARPLQAQSPAGGVPVKTYTGYFENMAVYFTAFETSSAAFAQANGLVYAPRLSLANRAVVPQMLFFPNVAPPQTVVLQTQPGRSNYNPIVEVLVAYWKGGGKMPLIASYAAAVQYNRQGLLLVQRTGILLNAPVVWINMNLNRQGGQLAPTISPNEVLGINPAARTVFFRSHPTYYNGQLTAFLALEHAAGVIQFAPGAIPVPTIQTNTLGHNAIANLYEVQGQQIPVIDTFPQSNVVVTNPSNPPSTGVYTIQGKPVAGDTGGQKPVGGQTGQTGQQPYPVAGSQGQGQPVGGSQGQGQPYPVGGSQGGQNPVGGNQGQQNPVGGQTGEQPGQTTYPPVSPGSGQPSYASLYSPIWHVHHVIFRPGVAPRLLRSLQEIQQAANLGQVTVQDGGVAAVFNCPVITGPQPYNPVSPGTGYNPPATDPYNPNPGSGVPVYPVTPTQPY
jgi:hypothetical protein